MFKADTLKRQKKRILNQIKKKFQKANKTGTFLYCEDCNYNPCIVTYFDFHYQDLYGATVEVKSIIDGREGSCSYFHCGIVFISKEEAYSRLIASPPNY